MRAYPRIHRRLYYRLQAADGSVLWVLCNGRQILAASALMRDPVGRKLFARMLRNAWRLMRATVLRCPRCRQLKDGTGCLCAYCSREQRIETEESMKP